MSLVALKPIDLSGVFKKIDHFENLVGKNFTDALNKSLILIENDAVKSISEHRSSGRTYKRGTVEHTASTPGSPPNADTGGLIRSITRKLDAANNSGTVGTDLGYGAALEFGTSNNKPAKRPWLVPAYERNLEAILKLFVDSVLNSSRAVKK